MVATGGCRSGSIGWEFESLVFSHSDRITIKVDIELIREAKRLAAEEGSSISALLAAKLEEIVRQRKNYDAARRRALARLKKGIRLALDPACLARRVA